MLLLAAAVVLTAIQIFAQQDQEVRKSARHPFKDSFTWQKYSDLNARVRQVQADLEEKLIVFQPTSSAVLQLQDIHRGLMVDRANLAAHLESDARAEIIKKLCKRN